MLLQVDAVATFGLLLSGPFLAGLGFSFQEGSSFAQFCLISGLAGNSGTTIIGTTALLAAAGKLKQALQVL
jgi:hypothetical protein